MVRAILPVVTDGRRCKEFRSRPCSIRLRRKRSQTARLPHPRSRGNCCCTTQPWKLLLHNAAADNASSFFALADRPPNDKGPDPLRY